MKFISPLSFDIRHSLFIIRYSFLVVALPRCDQAKKKKEKKKNVPLAAGGMVHKRFRGLLRKILL